MVLDRALVDRVSIRKRGHGSRLTILVRAINMSASVTLIGMLPTAVYAQHIVIGGPTDGTFSGSVGGTGGVIKEGSGTETMTGTNTYTGGTTINAGTLAIGAGGSLASTGAVTLTGAGTGFDISAGDQSIGVLAGVAGSTVTLGGSTLTVNGVGNAIFSGIMAGTGGLIKNGAGVQMLDGDNTYAGGTVLNAGGLVLGSDTAMGTGALTIGGAATLETSAAINLANDINVASGADLNLLGSNTLTLGGVIAGNGGLVKNGAATVTLTNANTYAGGTTINSGTLAIGAGGSLLSTGAVNLTGTGAFDISAAGNQTIGSLAGVAGSTVSLGGSNLTLNGVGDAAFAGTITGFGGLVKNGAGAQTLSGANTFTGGVTLNAGGLIVGNSAALGAGTLTVGGTASLDSTAAVTLPNNVVLNAGLIVSGTHDLTLNGNLSGVGQLSKDGAATLTLNGINSYTGGTLISAGTLALGAGASLSATAPVFVATGATLDISAGTVPPVFGPLAGGGTVNVGANSLAVGGPLDDIFTLSIVGAGGMLFKQGTGRETLTGTNTYTGGTTIDAGVLAIGPGGSLASTGTVTLMQAGAGFDISNGGNQSIGALDGTAGTVQLGGNTLTLGGTGPGSYNGSIIGTGALVKSGSGMQILGGPNTFAGGTTLNAGSLVLGDNGALGTGDLTVAGSASLDAEVSISVSNDVVLAAGVNLDLMGSNDLVLGGAISGDGGLVKNGAATVTLTNANTYTGGTTINNGTLALNTGGSLASTGNVNLAGTGTFDISGGGNQSIGSLSGVAGSTVATGGNTLTLNGVANTTFNGSISGGANGALVKNGAGIQTLSGANTFGGGVKLNAGGLVVGSNTALGTGTFTVGGASTLDASSAVVLTNDVLLNADLTVLGSNDMTLSGNLSGAGGLTKDGNAKLTLNGTNTYAGDTSINAGTLALGAGASLSITGLVNLATGATFDLSAGNGTQTFGTLIGDGTIVLGANDVTLGDSSNGIYSGSIGGVGGLTKNGSGTETLTGNNTYTGGTVINAGTLAIGVGGSLAPSGTVSLMASGTGFDISGGGNQSIGALNGATGSIVTLGGNTLTLASANNGGFNGVIAGTGGLVKNGNGTQTLGGANTYTGGTVINAGTLAIAAGGSLASTGAVNLAGPAAFDISAGGNQTIGALAGVAGSTVALGGNTLTVNGADDTVFDGVISGTGGLIKDGAGTLIVNAVNTYGGGTSVMGGTFEVGDADHPGASILGDVSIGGAGTLRGHGTIAGNVVSNGTVRPGGSIGTLTVTGNYTQSPSGTLFIDVSPSSASQLKVGGNASLAGTLNVLYGPGTYSAASYRILDAGSVSGQFSSITGNTPAGFVQDVQTQAAGATLALSPQVTGGTVVVAPTNATIFGAIGSAAIREGQRVNEALLSRLGQACADAAAAADCARPGQQAWAQVVSNTAHVRGNDEAPSYKDSHYGFLAGVDRQAGAWTVGVAGGYSHVDVSEDEASGKIDTVRLAGYGSRRVGPVDVAATVGVAYDFLNSRRSFPGLNSARGNTDGQEITAGLQASLPMATGPVIVTPRMGLRYQYFHADSFDETGAGSQNLDVRGQDISSLQPYAQLSVGLPFHTSADKPALVEARVGYAYETLDAGRNVNASASDGTRFSLPGVAPSRGMLSAGLGVTLPVGKSVDVSASYDRLFDTGNVSAQVFQLQASYRF
ncbi:hypothetical protein CAL12_21065 [Bordetella genomosp. 8]|uniref:Autotransporter domain-containing protein n=1 Tax=Bordetella genomosp. 8 TaxID=1416806 RepID=A0A1W6YPW6_9BORD|nr:autotransporter-associated beta strand repeat-containing protein [Bordetella genomosp. 8]ARP83061.1 hypothetical protein CAL12_21065 [Bordetella genomosp. 8]